jgi:hypothetical protein
MAMQLPVMLDEILVKLGMPGQVFGLPIHLKKCLNALGFICGFIWLPTL